MKLSIIIGAPPVKSGDKLMADAREKWLIQVISDAAQVTDTALSWMLQAETALRVLSVHFSEHQGGTFEIESEIGRGTVVTVRFPPARVLPG